MIRLRTPLLLLAITALLLSVAPVFAAAGDSGLPSWITAPATSPGLDAGRCPDPGPSAALGMPAALNLAVPPPNDFILCSCELCKDYPDVICQISPSGYSILCADYSRLNCKSGPVS
jgi:hypothetical protein